MSTEGDLSAPRPSSGSSRARSGRGGALAAGALAAFVFALIGFAGGWMLGGRRTVISLESPARDAAASVVEGRCAAGRCQLLRLQSKDGVTRTLETLTGDEQAGEIAWTPDGGRVGFVVNGYQLRVFDAHTGANLGAASLIEPDGAPPSRIVRGVTFSTNGAAVTFDDCPREHSGCRPGLVALRLGR